jgi:hypothetical protein
MNHDNIWLAMSLIALGALVGLWVRKRIRRHRARSWPSAWGRVDSTSVELEGSGTEHAKFYGGKLCRNFMLDSRANKWVASYPKDRTISVRYDPAREHHSVLFEDEQDEQLSA